MALRRNGEGNGIQKDQMELLPDANAIEKDQMELLPDAIARKAKMIRLDLKAKESKIPFIYMNEVGRKLSTSGIEREFLARIII
jgi:hypothetical protein